MLIIVTGGTQLLSLFPGSIIFGKEQKRLLHNLVGGHPGSTAFDFSQYWVHTRTPKCPMSRRQGYRVSIGGTWEPQNIFRAGSRHYRVSFGATLEPQSVFRVGGRGYTKKIR